MPPVSYQHYVSQFYLRNFSPNGKYICVFDKVLRRSFPARIDRTAGDWRFYNVPAESVASGNPQAVDNTLTELEGQYAVAIRDLLNEVERTGTFTTGRSPRNEVVAHFLTIQASRTREFRDSLTLGIQDVVSTLNELQQNARSNLADRGEAIGGQYSDIPAPPEMTALDQAKFMFHEPYVAWVMRILFNHIWLIGENSTPQKLYTSDAPVIRCGNDESPHIGNAGFGSFGVEIILPLSSRHVLILLEKEWFGPKLKVTSGAGLALRPYEVTRFNKLQVWCAHKQIYCEEDRFDLVREMIEESPEICDQNHPLMTTKRDPE